VRVYILVFVIIQNSKRNRRIMLLSLACLAVQYFSTLSHKIMIFGEIIIEHKMCDLIFSTAFVLE